jgi:hypothetical protein
MVTWTVTNRKLGVHMALVREFVFHSDMIVVSIRELQKAYSVEFHSYSELLIKRCVEVTVAICFKV